MVGFHGRVGGYEAKVKTITVYTPPFSIMGLCML